MFCWYVYAEKNVFHNKDSLKRIQFELPLRRSLGYNSISNIYILVFTHEKVEYA